MTAIAASEAPAGPAAQLGRRQILIIMGGLLLGMLLAALDQTIVATALPTIAGDLHSLSRHGSRANSTAGTRKSTPRCSNCSARSRTS